jgi:hypothetical protein
MIVRTTPSDHRTRRRLVRGLTLLAAVGSCLGVGCRGLFRPDSRYDLIEAELRTRERELLETRAERDRLRQLNHLYQQQFGGCPPAATFHDAGRARQDGPTPTYPVRDVALGSGTGGVDEDGRPGDESLMAVIVPRDSDGTAVKVPARATVLAYEVSREGLKTPIGKWEVTPDQIRPTWRGGLLTSGYFVPLQWDRPPGTERLRVAVRLTTLDGRTFEADRDVTIRPLLGSAPHTPPPIVAPPPVIPPATVPDTPHGVEELPPPAARLKLPKLP